MDQTVKELLLALVVSGEAKYDATNYMDTPYALRSIRIVLNTHLLSTAMLKKYQLITTPLLSRCGIYVHLPTNLILVLCEDNGSFVIRKNKFELMDVIIRAQINKDVVGSNSFETSGYFDDLSHDPKQEADDFYKEESVDYNSLMAEFEHLEETYDITIPVEVSFNQKLDPNESHSFVDLENRVLNYTRQIPLLPIYMGVLNPVTGRIRQYNFNEPFYKSDMVNERKNLVFYQNFYISIKTEKMIVTPLGPNDQPLPQLEELVNALLVPGKICIHKYYKKPEPTDIVSKIMQYYAQLFMRWDPQNSPPPPSSDIDEVDTTQQGAPLDTTPSRNRILPKDIHKVKLVNLQNAEETTIKTESDPQFDMSKIPETKSESDPQLNISKMTKSIKLIRSLSEDEDDEDEDDLVNMSKTAPSSTPASKGNTNEPTIALNKIAEKSLGVPNTALGIHRKILVHPQNRNLVSENSTPTRLPRKKEMNAKRQIHEVIVIDLEEPRRTRPSSVLEVEQSKIISSSSQSQSQSQQKGSQNEVINSTTSSTDADKHEMRSTGSEYNQVEKITYEHPQTKVNYNYEQISSSGEEDNSIEHSQVSISGGNGNPSQTAAILISRFMSDERGRNSKRKKIL